MILGCKIYVKEIVARTVAEKEGALKEGDEVLQINGTLLDNLSLKEAKKVVESAKDKLELQVKRSTSKGILSIQKENNLNRLEKASIPPRPPLPSGMFVFVCFVVCFVCACPIYIIDTVPNGEGCTTTDTQRYRYTDTLTDTDTTDTANNTANSRQINTIIDEIDTAIDEALKTESEKLYEEACSIISSPGNIDVQKWNILMSSILKL